jgi:hypothetical protein
MNTPMEMTIREVEKFISNWRLANPTKRDGYDILRSSLGEMWPSENVGSVLERAMVNSINEKLINADRRDATDTTRWVNTHIQGDLFCDREVVIPRRLIIDGVPKEYFHYSPLELKAFLASRELSLEQEEDVLREALTAKSKELSRVQTMLAEVNEQIGLAESNGIDPSTLRYAKK